mmetsp:Transcript_56/g.220  ORF Transcript_56/g.220 Transcript_56/m.220 type:complete len:213 (+) Transcript_56:3160-3798(+)
MAKVSPPSRSHGSRAEISKLLAEFVGTHPSSLLQRSFTSTSLGAPELEISTLFKQDPPSSPRLNTTQSCSIDVAQTELTAAYSPGSVSTANLCIPSSGVKTNCRASRPAQPLLGTEKSKQRRAKFPSAPPYDAKVWQVDPKSSTVSSSSMAGAWTSPRNPNCRSLHSQSLTAPEACATSARPEPIGWMPTAAFSLELPKPPSNLLIRGSLAS